MAAKSGAYRRERAEGDERSKRTARRRAAPENTATNLDRLIHERTRLAIVSALAVNESLTFNELKQLLRATDGNLSVHARKFEDAGYLGCTKSFDGRMPKTEYRLTRRRPPRARKISESHGSSDPRHARRLGSQIFLPGYSMNKSTLKIIPSTRKLHVAILLDGNGRWASSRGLVAPKAIAPESKPSAASSAPLPAWASAPSLSTLSPPITGDAP